MTHRRRKLREKSARHRVDELPWELPAPLEPIDWPSQLCEKLKALFESSSSNAGGGRRNSSSEMFSTGSNNIPSTSTIAHNNDRKSQPWLPGNSGIASTNFPTVAFTDIKCDSKQTAIHSINAKTLPPIGVFWDIENCSVPKGRSALVAAQRLRERFFLGHVEAEFLCVCDIRKESASVIQELNDAQVSVVHVSGNSKNAADDKLRQAMRRFADISCSNPINSEWIHPATLILISGDINFVADLSDLRYRKRLYIILLHNKQTPDALLMCAHEHYEFHAILTGLPFRAGYRDYAENSSNFYAPLKGGLSRADVVLGELPESNNPRTQDFIRNRLRRLSENCGGKVMDIRGRQAVIRFPNAEAALRASKRMNGEDVLGNKIRVIKNQQMDFGEFHQMSNIREEFSFNHFANTYYNKSNYGMYKSSGIWKPTWKPASSASDSFRPGPSQYNFADECKNQNTQSNSSSVETSRDDSPTLMCQNSISGPSQLNTASQFPSSSMTSNMCPMLDSTASAFQQQQNLYATMDASMDMPPVNPEYQQQQQGFQFKSDGSGAGTCPRLYSTLANPDNGRSPMQPRGQYSIHSQPNPNRSKPLSIINGSNSYKNRSTPPYKGGVESRSGENGATSGSVEIYGKSRSQEGDSFNLTVTNIDPNAGDWRAIRAALTSAFAEHVSVRGVWVSIANDGSVTATVRLNNKDDARYALSKLHKQHKIGNKKISISLEQGNSIDNVNLKKEVASLLLDVPNHTLPFFKFRNMFEKRYKRSVVSSELYHMKDVVVITESSPSGSGSSTPVRNISLAPNWHIKEGKGLNIYCNLHPPKAQGSSGWAEKEAEVMLPSVIIEIKVLGTRIHTLLQSHEGGLPLISFLDCYEAEFGALEIATEGHGVPLEHLITCVQGVEIVYGENGMKRVQWHEKKEGDHHVVHPPLATLLAQFGRELIDLLKTFPKCSLPFNRLIPSYHAHFGRQCKVSDYGHDSLKALLQTLPHIIQIMGDAQNRILTLSHRAQMKRFATDMLRVLKSQGGPKKQIRTDDFPSAFLNVFSQRQFQPEDYGLCFFSDLVTELVENTTLVALVKDEEGQQWLAVPKREQTPHEIYRTRLFAAEVVELLRHSTRCELEFSKFVPYYHHHFQKQCRVSEYGFGKLAELFDAINDTVIIVNPSTTEVATEDKIIRLTPKEQIKVVGEQICNIIEKRAGEGLSTKLYDLVECFLEEHGFALRPELCGATSLDDLVINKLNCFVKVIDGEIVAVDRIYIEELAQKAETILQQADGYCMKMKDFIAAMNLARGDSDVNELTLEKDLDKVIVVSTSTDDEKTVSLTPLRAFAYEMTLLLESYDGTIPLSTLEAKYYERFNRPLRPAQQGYPTVLPMLQAISDVVTVQGKHRTKRMIVLNSVKPTTESTSDESNSTYGRHTPRSGRMSHWKSKDGRYSNPGNSMKGAKYSGAATRRRRSAPLPLPPPLFSPLASPAFAPHHAEVFTFERPPQMSPQMYDMWVPDSVAPGSPPISPPVVWTCHPIYYPSSPNSATPGNILVTSPYVTPAPWSPPTMNSNCYEQIVTTSAPPSTMMGNEYLFGQPHRLAASFDKMGLGINATNDNEM